MNTKINEILQEIESVIVGKNEIVEKILMAILAQGHVLMEDVPGVGKTTTAMAFAKVLGLETRRVQFTSDTVPSDIIGFSVYDKKADEFVYKPGAIMTNLLLADEINRTSSKTQSALLEAMEEHKVTVDGKTYALPDPFIVLATQNPVGSAGTTMLPNSQLDRFLIRVSMGYPDHKSSVNILRDRHVDNPLDRAYAVVNKEELLGLVKYCEDLFNEEYAAIETPISFTAERVELPAGEVPEEIQDNLIDAIFACQNGVTRMIPTVPDTVETSSNLAIITIGGGKAAIKILARSSSDSMKEYLTTSLESCFSMAGMKVEMTGGYSGWQPNVDSPILHAMKESYKQQFGVEPAVKVIHAGLECGIIGAIIPGLDMISFGPTLRSPHSPDERALIPTVQKFYDFLVATLAQTPMK